MLFYLLAADLGVFDGGGGLWQRVRRLGVGPQLGAIALDPQIGAAAEQSFGLVYDHGLVAVAVAVAGVGGRQQIWSRPSNIDGEGPQGLLSVAVFDLNQKEEGSGVDDEGLEGISFARQGRHGLHGHDLRRGGRHGHGDVDDEGSWCGQHADDGWQLKGRGRHFGLVVAVHPAPPADGEGLVEAAQLLEAHDVGRAEAGVAGDEEVDGITRQNRHHAKEHKRQHQEQRRALQQT